MAGRLVVMTAPDYARWTNAQPEADALAHQGEALFHALGCSGCHAPPSRIHAPDLPGRYGRAVPLADGRVVTADEAYLRDSILLPAKDIVAGYAPIMPSFRSAITEDDLVKLIAYLKSLSTAAGNAAASDAPLKETAVDRQPLPWCAAPSPLLAWLIPPAAERPPTISARSTPSSLCP